MGIVVIDDDYVREVLEAARAEEEEMKASIHPSQIIPKIKKYLKENNIKYSDIVFDWKIPGPCVKLSLKGADVKDMIINYSTLPDLTPEEESIYTM